MRLHRALPALLLLAGCSSGSPAAKPSPAPSATTAKPRPKPKPKPKVTPSSPAPTSVVPTTPPPATGDPIGTAGALLTLVADPGPARTVSATADCAKVFPEVTRPTCGATTMAGGGLLWVKGRVDGAGYVRLLVQQPGGGYVARYEGRDDGRSWRSVATTTAPLAGQGTDGVVVTARLVDGAATYDLLTWVAGGPLVLRAHRAPLADGRLAARAGGLDEYARAGDGTYVRRRVAWDGRRFLVSAPSRATGALPPR
jgi:hypothetical protein